MRATAAGTCLIVLLGIAACGGDQGASEPPSEMSPREVALSYFRALADGDGRKACGYFTPQLRARSARYVGSRSCAESVRKISTALTPDKRRVLQRARVARVRVRGSDASVRLTGDKRYAAPDGPRTIRLRRTPQGWKLASLGGALSPAREAARECIRDGLDAFDKGTTHPFWRREGRADFRVYLTRFCARVASGVKYRPSQLKTEAGVVIVEMIREGRIADPR